MVVDAHRRAVPMRELAWLLATLAFAVTLAFALYEAPRNFVGAFLLWPLLFGVGVAGFVVATLAAVLARLSRAPSLPVHADVECVHCGHRGPPSGSCGNCGNDR